MILILQRAEDFILLTINIFPHEDQIVYLFFSISHCIAWTELDAHC